MLEGINLMRIDACQFYQPSFELVVAVKHRGLGFQRVERSILMFFKGA